MNRPSTDRVLQRAFVAVLLSLAGPTWADSSTPDRPVTDTPSTKTSTSAMPTLSAPSIDAGSPGTTATVPSGRNSGEPPSAQAAAAPKPVLLGRRITLTNGEVVEGMLVEQVPNEKLVLLVPDGQVRSLQWKEIQQNEMIAPPATKPQPTPVYRSPSLPPVPDLRRASLDREHLDKKDDFGSVLVTLTCQEHEKLSYLSRKDGAVRVPLESQNSQDVRLARFSRYELHGSFPSVSLPRADGAMVIFVTPGSTGNNVLGKFMVGLGGAGVGASVGILIAAGFIGLVTSVTDPLTGKKTSDGTDLAKVAGVVGGISLAVGGVGAALWATSGTKLTVSKE